MHTKQQVRNVENLTLAIFGLFVDPDQEPAWFFWLEIRKGFGRIRIQNNRSDPRPTPTCLIYQSVSSIFLQFILLSSPFHRLYHRYMHFFRKAVKFLTVLLKSCYSFSAYYFLKVHLNHFFKDNKSKRSHETLGSKIFLTIFA